MPDNSEVPQVEVIQQDLGAQTDISLESLSKEYKYRWVKKLPLIISRKKQKGYQIVLPSEEDLFNFAGDRIDPAEDGTYTMGDVVLMRVRKSRYIENEKAKKRQTDQRLRSPVRKFKKEGKEKVRKRYGHNLEVSTTEED